MSYDDTTPEQIERAFDDSIEELDELQRTYAEGAQLAGYARDCLKGVKPWWVGLAHEAWADPEKMSLLNGAMGYFSAYHPYIQSLLGQAGLAIGGLQAAAGSAATFQTATDALSSIVAGPTLQIEYTPMPVSIQSGRTSLCVRLDKLSRALGNACREIREALYGTTADPERAATYQMRQVFDQLFGHLAPDDDVRKSRFWKPKKGDKPNAVWRRERIEYAALTHVQNADQAAILVESAKQILRVYGKLNRAHDRGDLNPSKARRALSSMERMLTDWADALGL